MSNVSKVLSMVNEACVYIPFHGEAMRIDAVVAKDGVFYGTGEETGEQYSVELTEVDLDNDLFYKMVLMEIPA